MAISKTVNRKLTDRSERTAGVLQSRETTTDTPRSAGLASLLWPPGADRSTVQLTPAVVADLALDRIIHALNVDGRHERAIRSALCTLCTDAGVIRYRQDILVDLLDIPDLAAALQQLLPDLAGLSRPSCAGWQGDSPVLSVTARLDELDQYVNCLDRLRSILDNAGRIRSVGLLGLRDGVRALADEPEVATLRAELPALHELVAETTSVTIGINLGPDLKPESGTIVELNRNQFKGRRTLIGRLLPSSTSETRHGITPLQQVGPVGLRKESKLYQDLEGLLEAAVAPLSKALARYRDLTVGLIAPLEEELAFLTGASMLLARLQNAGISICRPEIAPTGERALTIAQAINPTLALQMLSSRKDQQLKGRIITNDVDFGPKSRVLILTGPNRGGKTTYCRSMGQAQVLFQTGLYVPGVSARISPVDGIWTHFPLPEVDRPGSGRLDDEVQRLRRIFTEATASSLILLNEPLTSTSERGALSIARDLVQALLVLGSRVLLVTHLHDLALTIAELNEASPNGSRAQSLVAGATETDYGVTSTFRIVPGTPAGRSYSTEIARQHGLTFTQLKQLLADRAAGEPNPTV